MRGWLGRKNPEGQSQVLLPKTLRSSLVTQGLVETGLLKRSSTSDLEPCGDLLGEGSYGVVKLRRNRNTGEPRAVKTVLMPEHWDRSRLIREAEVMQNLDHPHILRLFGWHTGINTDGQNCMTMVTEYCEGGEITTAVRKAKSEGYSVHQGWLAGVFRQLFEAMHYCHDRGLIHRDIKSGNILLMRGVGPNQVLFKTCPYAVIVDLGLAQMFENRRMIGVFSKGTQIAGGVGTAGTMAPEVWHGIIGPKADMWSLGCVFYELLANKLPYMPADRQDTARETWTNLLKTCQVDWVPILGAFGEEAKDIAVKLLMFEEKLRPSAAEVINHAWFGRFLSSCPQDTTGNIQVNDLTKLCTTLCGWKDVLPMPKAFCLKLASENIGCTKFAQIFSRIDTDNSGTLSREELIAALVGFGVAVQLARDVAEALDYNGDGSCEYLEFAAACLSSLGREYDEMLWQEFCVLDLRNAGKLNKGDFQTLVSKLKPLCASRNLPFADIDASGDGFIDFAEFGAVFGRFGQDYTLFRPPPRLNSEVNAVAIKEPSSFALTAGKKPVPRSSKAVGQINRASVAGGGNAGSKEPAAKEPAGTASPPANGDATSGSTAAPKEKAMTRQPSQSKAAMAKPSGLPPGSMARVSSLGPGKSPTAKRSSSKEASRKLALSGANDTQDAGTAPPTQSSNGTSSPPPTSSSGGGAPKVAVNKPAAKGKASSSGGSSRDQGSRDNSKEGSTRSKPLPMKRPATPMKSPAIDNKPSAVPASTQV